MEDPEYGSRDMRDLAHDLKYAARRMEHEMKHAHRERMRTVKEAFIRRETSGPRTVDEVLVEIDSYISYLEDLPAEKLAPYEKNMESIAAHFEKVRNTLKNR